jgi:hypothetical protein
MSIVPLNSVDYEDLRETEERLTSTNECSSSHPLLNLNAHTSLLLCSMILVLRTIEISLEKSNEEIDSSPL